MINHIVLKMNQVIKFTEITLVGIFVNTLIIAENDKSCEDCKEGKLTIDLYQTNEESYRYGESIIGNIK